MSTILINGFQGPSTLTGGLGSGSGPSSSTATLAALEHGDGFAAAAPSNPNATMAATARGDTFFTRAARTSRRWFPGLYDRSAR